jgi:hypothetical protein
MMEPYALMHEFFFLIENGHEIASLYSHASSTKGIHKKYTLHPLHKK